MVFVLGAYDPSEGERVNKNEKYKSTFLKSCKFSLIFLPLYVSLPHHQVCSLLFSYLLPGVKKDSNEHMHLKHAYTVN